MKVIRPGVYDDEELPNAAATRWNYAGRTWDGRPNQADVSPYDPAARRPAWPAIAAGQNPDTPAPTDLCRLHDGSCSGACERYQP